MRDLLIEIDSERVRNQIHNQALDQLKQAVGYFTCEAAKGTPNSKNYHRCREQALPNSRYCKNTTLQIVLIM